MSTRKQGYRQNWFKKKKKKAIRQSTKILLHRRAKGLTRGKKTAAILSVTEQGLATDHLENRAEAQEHQARSLNPVRRAKQTHFVFGNHLGGSESHALV